MKDGIFEVGDRVKYVGNITPGWREKTGIVTKNYGQDNISVKWDDMLGNYGVVAPSIKLIPPENLGTESSKTTESVFAVNSDAMEPDANRSGLVDSGERVAFGTGAVREATGKGRCDLLPWDVVLWADPQFSGATTQNISEFCNFMDDAVRHNIGMEDAIRVCLDRFYRIAFDGNRATGILAAAHQFEAGAIKYKDGRNWEKGIPLNCFLSSAGRHFLKYLRGDTDEPHDRAVVWNLLCALWTVKHKPEMIDAEVPHAK